MYADIKLSTYNFIQTPLGANSIKIVGPLVLQQANPYDMGSVKRIINYDIDNLAVYL